MTDYNYSIFIRWRVVPTLPTEIGTRFLRTLDLIAEAAPQVGAWMIMSRPFSRESLSVDQARKIIPRLMEDNVAVIDEEPNAKFGYYLIARNSWDFSPGSTFFSTSVGGRFGDSLSFGLGSYGVPSDPDLVTYPLFRAALLIILELWPSVWANAYAFRMGYDEAPSAPGIPPFATSPYKIPWLSYLSAPLAAGLIPPPDVPCERTPDGGLLMVAAEERLDPTDPAQMLRSRAIADIMIARAGSPAALPGYRPWSEGPQADE